MPKKKQPVSDEILATIRSRSESELRNAIGAHAVAVKTIKDEMDSDPDVIAAKATLDAAKEKYKELTGPYKADMKTEDVLLNANHEELMRRGGTTIVMSPAYQEDGVTTWVSTTSGVATRTGLLALPLQTVREPSPSDLATA